MLLFTEAHLEYNAGLVISIGNRNKHSPLEHDTSALTLAKEPPGGSPCSRFKSQTTCQSQRHSH